jgi:membrane-anchored protein YejM (alkaline phosphatase superfamily)
VGEVLQAINESGILKNTVVIITSDHGQEFNDNGQNYWGHNGNFSEYQTKVPLIIRWPGKQPQTYTHLTTHFDLAPTLMQDLLVCSNAASDYSLGKNLLDTTAVPYLILSSYNHYAIKQPQGITVVDEFGQMDYYTPDYLPTDNLNLSPNLIVKVMDEMSYFYKK